MSAFDKLQGWSFDGIKFPAERWNIRGGQRDHVHEYWKTDGGDPELAGIVLEGTTGPVADTEPARRLQGAAQAGQDERRRRARVEAGVK